MKDIKTRESTRDVKVLDKSQVLGERMKSSLVQVKEKVNQGISVPENSPNEYAAARSEETAGNIKDTAIYEFNKQGQKGLRETKQNIAKAREKLKNQKSAEVPHQPSTTSNIQTSIVRQPAYRSTDAIRTAKKGTIKTADKSVKTAERTSKAAIKTTRQTAKTTQKTVEATAKASQKAAQAAKVTARAAAQAAKATAETIKAAAKAAATAVKSIITGTKALIAAIAAGGWIAVIVIIVVCVIALIVGSCFGIFFSGQDNGTGQTIQTAVQDINAEYQAKIDEIKAANTYDVLVMAGSPADWKDVLAVYAVKMNTNPDNPEVATMDDSKKEQLRSIFWQMNEISSRTESKTEAVSKPANNGQKSSSETQETTTKTYLYITVSHKTLDEMADTYNFSDDQRKQMSELLADENRSMWDEALSGSSRF